MARGNGFPFFGPATGCSSRPRDSRDLSLLPVSVYNGIMWICHSCGREVKTPAPISRQELCPHCRSDLHCCLNCSLYDPSAHNQCREPVAEWVKDREKNNFCEYFSFRDSAGAGRGRREKEEALAKLEALFKKKP